MFPFYSLHHPPLNFKQEAMSFLCLSLFFSPKEGFKSLLLLPAFFVKL